ncbi:nucleoside-diphosphate-sugar epimerase [Ilumatobacter fluminis]|uniref:Nucleoside-diphosphate-sugar epimerase n=1 Tax=Ilumatobacter fluminis TaxID=467091 RepID=A0A4R7I0B3_9ACTN|nr:NAD-dependent epimerase/dehydratase family protein [Ilumatobacter fluminis]TDT16835.1 nucleoside-diphosphate-sugar epimerase [Ilumatobacter fluminis]
MRILVTGATSMIGRATVERLLARGDDVRTIQRNPSGLPVAETLGSVTDPAAVRAACDGVDAVVHLAAKVGVTGEWHEYENVNVRGTELLVAAARQSGAGRFVHVSSPSVAHAGDALVGAGADPADPTATKGHYATSKALAEVAALDASSDDLPVVAIRPHLVWGPGDTQLVGRIVERARSGRLALVGSGAALIDTTVVDNAADALVAAVDRAPELGGQAFVVSNGEPRTVAELVARIAAAAGVDWNDRHVPTAVAKGGGAVAERVWARTGRTDDPPMTSFLAEQLSTAHWFDQRRTRDALGWRPAVTLAEGFERLAASYGSA